jgi:hypothetical protein
MVGWVAYLGLGLLLIATPLVGCASGGWKPWHDRWSRVAYLLRRVLTAALLAVIALIGLAIVAGVVAAPFFGAAVVAGFLAAVLVARIENHCDLLNVARLCSLIATPFALVSLMLDGTMREAPPTPPHQVLLGCTLLVTFLAGLVLCWSAPPGERRHTLLPAASHVGFLVILLALAQSTAPIANEIGRTVHHWGVITGPVDMVRHGGQLLYDVPSQYGLANVLLVVGVARVAESSWDALWYTIVLLVVLQGLMLYAMLGKLVGARPAGWPLAGFVVLLSMFVLPGLSITLGTSVTPGNGPFRYVVVVALAFYVVIFGDVRSARRFLLGGSILWLAGCFWSAEALVWCSAVWLPTAALRVVSNAAELGIGLAATLRRLVLVALGHAAALTLAVLIGTVISLLVYGHAPDPERYFDYVRYFGQSTVPDIVRVRWSGAVLIFGTGVVLVGLIYLSRLGRWMPHLAQAYAAGLAGWAVSSYYVARSSPSIIMFLAPVLIPAVLAALPRAREPALGARALSAIALTAALLAVPVLFGWRARSELLHSLLGPQRPVSSMVPWHAPPAGPMLEELGRAHGEPIVYLDERLPDESWPAELRTLALQTPPWLPIVPDQLVWPLPPDVRTIYIRRWAQRQPRVGWLVVPLRPRVTSPGLSVVSGDEVIGALAGTHRVTTDVTGEWYRLIRFQPSPGPAR